MELKKYRLGEIVDFNKETISRQDNLLEIKYLDTSNILDNVIYETPSMKLSEAPSRAQRKVKHLTIIYPLRTVSKSPQILPPFHPSSRRIPHRKWQTCIFQCRKLIG